HFVNLTKNLRQSLDRERPGSILTIASPSGEWVLKHYNIDQLSKIIDWFNVMTYDYFGPWNSEWGELVGPNAPLYDGTPMAKAYNEKSNIHWSTEYHYCQMNGDDQNRRMKICMGLPFYGRYWNETYLTSETNNSDLWRRSPKSPNAPPAGGHASY